MSILPDKLKLVAWKGATFKVTMTLYQEDETGPVRNLTGYTAELEVLPSKGSSTKLLTLNTSNGGIVINGTNGTLTIIVSAQTIRNQTWNKGVYDLTITSPAPASETEPLFYGPFVIIGVD